MIAPHAFFPERSCLRARLDAHADLFDAVCQLGRTCSRVLAERDPDAICRAIRADLVSLQTTPVPVLELAQVLGGMMRRGNRKQLPAPGYQLPASSWQP